MGWASHHISKLQDGKTVKFRPRGHSMKGRIESGELCTVAPLTEIPEAGDVVLCKVLGKEYLHLIKSAKGDRFQIGNNTGRINGWVGLNSIFGKLIKVES